MSMLPAKIGIEGIVVPCIIGCLEWERQTLQELIVDIYVEVDVGRCVNSDSLEDTIDYRILADLATEVAQQGKYKMVEALAGNVLQKVLECLSVPWASIKIRKPGGAVIEMARGQRL